MRFPDCPDVFVQGSGEMTVAPGIRAAKGEGRWLAPGYFSPRSFLERTMTDLPRNFWGFSGSVQRAPDRHEVRVCDDLGVIDDTECNRLVKRRPEGTIFHRHKWLNPPTRPVRANVAARNDGNFVGVLPQFETDLPKVPLRRIGSVFPGFGGPVVGTDYAGVLGGLLSKSAEPCGGRRVLHDLRAWNPELLRYTHRLGRRGHRLGSVDAGQRGRRSASSERAISGWEAANEDDAARQSC